MVRTSVHGELAASQAEGGRNPRRAAAAAPSLDSEVRLLEGRLGSALEVLGVPAFLADARGRIRWLNAAGRRLVGDAAGRSFSDVVTRADRAQARTVFSRKLLGTSDATDVRLSLVAPDGAPVPVEISSAAVRDGGRVVGVFGIARALKARTPAVPGIRRRETLTARQLDVLRLLAEGRTTQEIAGILGLSTETVRNHIRHLLRELGVHSRLQAVVRAGELGILSR